MNLYKILFLLLLFNGHCLQSHAQEDSIAIEEILEEIEQRNENEETEGREAEEVSDAADIIEDVIDENIPEAEEEYIDVEVLEDLGEEDTLRYETNNIDDATLDEYYSNPKFQYKRNQSKGFSNNNIFSRFFGALFNILERTLGFQVPSWIFPVIKWLFLLGIFTGAIYFLARFAGIELNFKPKPKPKLEEISFETLEENLEEVDFDDLLTQAIKEKSYRVAVRLFFLKNLQSLTKKDLIYWAIDKTNNDYKYELSGTNLLKGFENTIYLFEHIWYGHFDLDEAEFQQALNTFRKFQNSIANEK